MSRTQSTVRVADIPGIIADNDRGIISLVGDHGGIALITGALAASAVVFGALAIETEHGTIYLDENSDVTISEEFPRSDGHEWLVSWNIDSYGSSPERAAARVWFQSFGRTMAGNDDACSFTVTDTATGESVNVDLSEFDLESLID